MLCLMLYQRRNNKGRVITTGPGNETASFSEQPVSSHDNAGEQPLSKEPSYWACRKNSFREVGPRLGWDGERRGGCEEQEDTANDTHPEGRTVGRC